MSASFIDDLVVPLQDLLASTPVGGEVERARCEQLAAAIDGLFRTEAALQYSGWPPGSTTGGTTIHLCVRPEADTLDVVGLTFIDFDGAVFPSRVRLRRRSDGSTSVTAFIGDVNPYSGEPPRLPAGTRILPVRDHDDGRPRPELVVGPKQTPIRWTRVFEVLAVS